VVLGFLEFGFMVTSSSWSFVLLVCRGRKSRSWGNIWARSDYCVFGVQDSLFSFLLNGQFFETS
jgi:hypothetical protein